jgi:hypothetical protein
MMAVSTLCAACAIGLAQRRSPMMVGPRTISDDERPLLRGSAPAWLADGGTARQTGVRSGGEAPRWAAGRSRFGPRYDRSRDR